MVLPGSRSHPLVSFLTSNITFSCQNEVAEGHNCKEPEGGLPRDFPVMLPRAQGSQGATGNAALEGT